MKNPCKKPTVCLDKFHAKPGKNVYFIYEFFTCVWCPIFHMYVWCPIWRWHRIKFRRAFASNVLYVCCIKRNERGFQNSEFPCRFIFFKMAGGLGIWVAVLGLPVKHGWQRRILLDANQDTRKHTGLKHTNHLLPLVVVWAVGWHYIVGENTQHKSPKKLDEKNQNKYNRMWKILNKRKLGGALHLCLHTANRAHIRRRAAAACGEGGERNRLLCRQHISNFCFVMRIEDGHKNIIQCNTI